MRNRTKIRTVRIATLTLLAAVLVRSPANGEHFNILLQVESGGEKATSMVDTTPPIGGVNPRPVCKTKSGEAVKISWKMSSGFPHGVMKAVTIHFFVVKQLKLGQKPVPDPSGSGGIIDNSVKMDFGPKGVTSGFVKFKAPDPGAYLVRIQSEDTHVDHDHEHFSAIDLSVE